MSESVKALTDVQELSSGSDEILSPLPLGAERQDNGDILYTLQHKVESKKVPESFTRVRLPKKILGRNIRHSFQGTNNGEQIFYLICSMSGISPDVLDELDGQDYVALHGIATQLMLENSRAILRTLGQ